MKKFLIVIPFVLLLVGCGMQQDSDSAQPVIQQPTQQVQDNPTVKKHPQDAITQHIEGSTSKNSQKNIQQNRIEEAMPDWSKYKDEIAEPFLSTSIENPAKTFRMETYVYDKQEYFREKKDLTTPTDCYWFDAAHFCETRIVEVATGKTYDRMFTGMGCPKGVVGCDTALGNYQRFKGASPLSWVDDTHILLHESFGDMGGAFIKQSIYDIESQGMVNPVTVSLEHTAGFSEENNMDYYSFGYKGHSYYLLISTVNDTLFAFSQVDKQKKDSFLKKIREIHAIPNDPIFAKYVLYSFPKIDFGSVFVKPAIEEKEYSFILTGDKEGAHPCYLNVDKNEVTCSK